MVSDKQARLVNALRRQILAAQLKVTLDEQLDRKTPDKVKRLAEIALPPIMKTRDDTVTVIPLSYSAEISESDQAARTSTFRAVR